MDQLQRYEWKQSQRDAPCRLICCKQTQPKKESDLFNVLAHETPKKVS